MAVLAMGFFYFFAVCMGLAGCGAAVYESVAKGPVSDSGTEDAPLEPASLTSDVLSTKNLFVYVCGAVRCPGVYELAAGARVFEAIEAAGGLEEDADLFSLNQAAPLADGQQLIVLTEEERKLQEENASLVGSGAVPEAGGSAEASDGRININTADAQQLMTLQGIGEKKAKDIIAYREENGPFSSIEEIMNVGGIKSAVFEKIRDAIVVA